MLGNGCKEQEQLANVVSWSRDRTSPEGGGGSCTLQSVGVLPIDGDTTLETALDETSVPRRGGGEATVTGDGWKGKGRENQFGDRIPVYEKKPRQVNTSVVG